MVGACSEDALPADGGKVTGTRVRLDADGRGQPGFQPLPDEACDNARQHIAHAKYARCHSVRMKCLECVDFLADADKSDRFARDLADREGHTAFRIAVRLGEHDASQRQTFIE